MLPTPIEIAVVEEETRHAENAGRFGFMLDAPMKLAALAIEERGKGSGVGTAFRQNGRKYISIFDIELAFPEAIEDPIVVGAEHALLLRIQETDRGK